MYYRYVTYCCNLLSKSNKSSFFPPRTRCCPPADAPIRADINPLECRTINTPERHEVFGIGLCVVVNDKNGRIVHIVDGTVVQFERIVWFDVGREDAGLAHGPITDGDAAHENVLDAIPVGCAVGGMTRIAGIAGKVHAPAVRPGRTPRHYGRQTIWRRSSVGRKGGGWCNRLEEKKVRRSRNANRYAMILAYLLKPCLTILGITSGMVPWNSQRRSRASTDKSLLFTRYAARLATSRLFIVSFLTA
jgi:hypothetical protein